MFGNKEFDGVGYPTPSSIPVETAYRLARIPSDASWLAVFMGMLEVGLSEENWQQFEGGITREAAVEVWMQIIADMYAFAENPTMLMDVRQNPASPCILEKTFDGETWEQFADLQKCGPVIRMTAAGQIQPGRKLDDGTFDYYTIDDGPPALNLWDGYTPTVAMQNNTNDQCTAAANAANVIQQLYYAVGQNLVANTVQAATAWIEAGASFLSIVFGAVIGPEFLATVTPALYAIQAAYAWSSMSDADFHDLACIFYQNMSGTAGNWTINSAGLTAAINAKAAASPVPWLLIRELLVFIDATGVNLAFKTNQISSYDCSAGTSVWLDQTLKSGASVGNNTNWQQYGSKPIAAQWGLTRARVIQSNITGNGQGTDNTTGTAAGYTDMSKPLNPSYVGAATPDIWWYNNTVFNATTAADAIRTILANPAATPTIVGSLGNVAAGAIPEIKWRSSVTLPGAVVIQTDIYVVKTFGGC